MHVLRNVPKPGLYYHYKHDSTGMINNYAYELIGVGMHTEDDCRPIDQMLAIYRPLYDSAKVFKEGKLFDVRPLSMWGERVNLGNDTSTLRFTRITDKKIILELSMICLEMYGEFPHFILGKFTELL